MSDRKPNWNKWKLIPNAKIWAVAALSLDIDPDKVKHNPQGWMANAFTTLEGQDFKDRVEVITANAMNDKSSLLYLVTLNQGGVEYCEISIANFAKWAISKSLSLPSELAGLASKEDEAIKSVVEKSLNEKATHANVSDKLAILNQASTKFWANADSNDNNTHPLNSTVAAWLIEREFTQTLADKGATIIRPTWATTGRKADK